MYVIILEDIKDNERSLGEAKCYSVYKRKIIKTDLL
jgi:hypothetical protein